MRILEVSTWSLDGSMIKVPRLVFKWKILSILMKMRTLGTLRQSFFSSNDRLPDVVKSLTEYLKPGGMFLVRDYGYCDMAQLRFKKGQCLSENFYHRGDNTLVHFFCKGDPLFFSQLLPQDVCRLERRLSRTSC